MSVTAEFPPHDRVLTRLGVSAIHGIGVFATRPLAAGTQVFSRDARDIVWVDGAVVAALPAASPERRFYDDFAIRRAGAYGCPPSFDLLGTGWYVNEPAAGVAPNIAVGPGFEMFAARDIADGEELTVAYASFSDTVPTRDPARAMAATPEKALQS